MVEKYSYCPHITDEEMRALKGLSNLPKVRAGWPSVEHSCESGARDVPWGVF